MSSAKRWGFCCAEASVGIAATAATHSQNKTRSALADVRPADGAVRTLSTDTQTRWIAHGTAAGHDGFPIGSTVRVTYIVKQGEQVATQVEAVGR